MNNTKLNVKSTSRSLCEKFDRAKEFIRDKIE